MAFSATLNQLADDYARSSSRASLGDLRKLAIDYRNANIISILDAAAIGLAFDIVFSADRVDVSQITPEMMVAWEKAYPNVPIESLADRSPEEIAGIISGWKGKLFEVEVEQRLNAGEWVGDLHLDQGQTAKIADSATQPGWDIRIFNENGQVADAIQLKAAESVGYVHEAFAKYPDTPILATHEVATKMASDGVLDSGISNEHLTDSVTEQIADATGDSLNDAVIGTMPVSVILATEAYGVYSGKKTVDDALSSGGDRLAKGAIAGGVGAAVSVFGTPFLGAVATILARLWLGNGNKQAKELELFTPPSIEHMRDQAQRLLVQSKHVSRYYPCEPISAGNHRLPALTDQQELLGLVDDVTRLRIEQGSMPLSDWLVSMISNDLFSMNKETLTRHFSDLVQIRNQGWIDAAYPTNTVDKLVDAFIDNDRDMLKRNLDAQIKLAHELIKGDGKVSPQRQAEIEYSRLSTAQRAGLKAKFHTASATGFMKGFFGSLFGSPFGR